MTELLLPTTEVRAALSRKGFANSELEWMRCTVNDFGGPFLAELRTGMRLIGTQHQTFRMRREQAEAVNLTHAYFLSRWAEDMHAFPRFLWNAKRCASARHSPHIIWLENWVPSAYSW